MRRAIRSQADDLQEEYSFASGFVCTGVDQTRQEFKAESDVNVMMARFMPFQAARVPQFGEQDFSITLQDAFTAIEGARRAWFNLPEDLQDRYPTWQAMLNAVALGEISADDLAPKPGAPVVPVPVPPVNPSVATS